ncbi:PulJ/GspJ family protein [Winogradskyella flava]|uniref:Prepilin-type N-terminal cleavage/methylation domain-containing protein n=1 Tax=Winogradskyella flava TaxID=1884876 RepID=A0A842IT91_9FLAO|nr:hypothetical protein [Winogradskyella flava]MBC2844637.1 hypothetical protein [Winogradskyella flava]
MKTKVKAFTLNEMVIVMIISTVVIGLAFTVLSLVQKHMWAIQENLKFNTELNRLEEVLWIDINNYNMLFYNDKKNVLKFKTILDSTSYQFHDNYVLRDKDSFHLKIDKQRYYFNGVQVYQGKVDAMKLSMSRQHKDLDLFVFKLNDAKRLMD